MSVQQTTVVSKAHRPGNAIMMVVNGLAPKGTSTSVNTIVNLLQFLYIQVHSNHVTQRTYRITGINSLRPSDACMRVSKLRCIGSDNGLSPGRRWAIIWPNAEILLIGPLGINYGEISIASNTFSSHLKMHLKMSSAKWRLFRFGLNELNKQCQREVGRSVTRWPWFNVKMLSCQCRGSHCGDQTT